jgi:hypothetical protein
MCIYLLPMTMAIAIAMQGTLSSAIMVSAAYAHIKHAPNSNSHSTHLKVALKMKMQIQPG